MREAAELIASQTDGYQKTVVARIADLLWSPVADLKRRARNRRVAARLELLDDHLLDDIGLRRADVELIRDQGIAAARTRHPDERWPRRFL
jgi:uncharacterized protein YjiS (DUF1127 family)